MPTQTELVNRYSKLRQSILSRHFAISRYFRTNHFTESCGYDLGPNPTPDQFNNWPVGDREKFRWKGYRDTDNPLLFGGLLMTCLAVEHWLGQPQAEKIIRTALQTLKSLYKFKGNNFDGYIIRWDPVTSDNWLPGDGTLERSEQFLINSDNQYIFCSSSSDPRHVPYRKESTLLNLVGPNQIDYYKSSYWEYFTRYRRWEASQDELAGLITSYFTLGKFVNSSGIRREVVRQANMLGNYLAEHAYLLVRPSGGLNSRGATEVLPAMEYPFVRALVAISGNNYASRTDFKGAMEKAGYWESLAGPLAGWTTLGVVGELLLAPMLANVFLNNGLIGLVPQAYGLLKISPPIGGVPIRLASAAIPLSSVKLARTYAIYAHNDCFDVGRYDKENLNTDANAVAGAFAMMEYLRACLKISA